MSAAWLVAQLRAVVTAEISQAYSVSYSGKLSAGSNEFNQTLISITSCGSNQPILPQPPISTSSFTVAQQLKCPTRILSRCWAPLWPRWAQLIVQLAVKTFVTQKVKYRCDKCFKVKYSLVKCNIYKTDCATCRQNFCHTKVKYRHPDLTKRDVLSLLHHYRYCFKKLEQIMYDGAKPKLKLWRKK